MRPGGSVRLRSPGPAEPWVVGERRLIALGLLFFTYAAAAAVLVPPHRLGPFWQLLALAAMFAVAQRTQVLIEFRSLTFSASASEIPLVLGLYLVSPPALVLAQAAGATAAMLWQRTSVHKSVFNVGKFAAEAASVVVLGHLLLPAGLGPVSWAVCYGLVLGVAAAGGCAVLFAIRLLNGHPTRNDVQGMLASAGLGGLINVTLALVALLAVKSHAWAVVLLVVLAAAVVTAYRLYSSLVERHRSLSRLYAFTRSAQQHGTFEEICAGMVAAAAELVNASYATVHLAPSGPGHDAGETDPLVEQVRRTGRAMLLPRRVSNGPRRQRLADRGQRDALLVPLQWDAEAGVEVAVLEAADRRGDMQTFTDTDVQALATLGAHASVALANGRLLDRLRHEATHDGLTGLANRSLLFEGIERLEPGSLAAVLLLDLDGFKDVNDTLGHHTGDLLLREISQRLAAVMPVEATVARLGGDEFAVLLPGAARDAALASAAELRETIAHTFQVDGLGLEVDVSIGVALVPDHGTTPLPLLQRADAAMYAAKRSGAGVRVHELGSLSGSRDKLTLASELRRGLRDGQLVVHYQPQVELATSQLVAVEALVRWQHPQRGLLMPDEFIAVAEQSGSISELTRVVLEDAVRCCATWEERGHPVSVAVNLSPRSLLDPNLLATVSDLLHETGLPPERLVLEVTESGVMLDPDAATAVLHQLAALGVRLSLDDFGTGYSSLSFLRVLPVHEVKIDKSFVLPMQEDAACAAIVRAIVGLAHHLGLRVVAEGVEDEAARLELLRMGCDTAQGYLLSRPLPAAAFASWASRWHTGTVPTPRVVRMPTSAG